ncbi:MAG: YibE/F family protein [bacterium]
MKKIIILIAILFLSPMFAWAQTEEAVFEAKVISIEDSRILESEDGSRVVQQNVRLKGLSGEWEGRERVTDGIGDLNVLHNIEVKPGDKILVSYLRDINGQERLYIIDHVRRGPLLWLALIFCALIILISRFKGLKALVSLAVSFLIIVYLVIPGVLAGFNPLLVSIACSFLILLLVIYITWGWSKQSHLAFFSIAISLIITGLFSFLFTILTKLTGLANEDIIFLIGDGLPAINFQGLLLAGIIIGTLGVLDDVVISQISTVRQLREANLNLSVKELFSRAMKVGIDHISSMANTLFLAYVGVSLPLLLLFKLESTAFHGFAQIINSEIIATEIVRTLTGSVGLILAVPIATFIAAKYWTISKVKKKEAK